MWIDEQSLYGGAVGEWALREGPIPMAICSRCTKEQYLNEFVYQDIIRLNVDIGYATGMYYCPNCGARMVG